MKKYIYSLFKPKETLSIIKNKNHCLYFKENKTYIIPKQPSVNYINPKSIYDLKKEYNIKKITILDRIKDINKEVCIINHVNRSGFNFLVGNTPFKEFPRFPDMSNLYNKIKGLETVVVHTVGIERFLTFKDRDVFVSEFIGLVSPVWHYVGVKVFAKNYLK